jgi:hypothetical protein
MKELTDEQKISVLAERGKKDFYFFMKYILGTMPGFDLIDDDPHKWMCEICQHWKKNKKMVLLPRDTFKTTVMVVGYCLWRIVNDPEIGILLTSDKMANSVQSLAAIKDVMERHELFRLCYGNMVGERNWTERQIVVLTRRGNKRAPTIMASGADSEKVGFHFDLILFDDPHNRKNISTPEQIAKIIQYYRGLLPILDTLTGQMQITATRWHHQDLENHILTEEAGDWDVYIKSAFWDGGLDDQQTKFFYPKRLTRPFLKQRLKELGSYFFACQYQNSPVDDENATFKSSQFKYFTVSDGYVYISENDKQIKFKQSDLTFFVLCDPAGRGTLTEQRRLDYTGIIVLGVDKRDNWYIFEAKREKGMQPSDIIDELVKKHYEYKPEVIGAEAITYQGQIKVGLDREFEARGIRQRVVDLHHHNRDKASRIKGLQPLYESGSIYHAKGLYDLELELLNWSPNSTIHDDLIDPLAYAQDIAFGPDHEEIELVESIDPARNPAFLINADIAWTKSGKRSSFKDFLEEFNHKEYEQEQKEELEALVASLN